MLHRLRTLMGATPDPLPAFAAARAAALREALGEPERIDRDDDRRHRVDIHVYARRFPDDDRPQRVREILEVDARFVVHRLDLHRCVQDRSRPVRRSGAVRHGALVRRLDEHDPRLFGTPPGTGRDAPEIREAGQDSAPSTPQEPA